MVVGPRLGRFNSVNNIGGGNGGQRENIIYEGDIERQDLIDQIAANHYREDFPYKLRTFMNRYDVESLKAHNVPLAVLGVLILWLGWLMFNAGSSKAIFDPTGRKEAEMAMMNSLLSPCASGLFSYFLKRHIAPNNNAGHLQHDESMPGQLGALMNGMMAGLVGVTAGAGIVDSWAAVLIGVLSSLIYILACRAMNKFQIDDPLEAF